MSSKKDYDKVVSKKVKSIRAIDRVYETKRSAADVRALAKRLVDSDNEIKVRGYVKGSIGDPEVQRQIKKGRKK